LVDLIPVELSGLDRLVDVGWVEGLTDLALFPSASDEDDELELLDEFDLLRFLQRVDSSCNPETLCIL